jgi:hypothetical protein
MRSLTSKEKVLKFRLHLDALSRKPASRPQGASGQNRHATKGRFGRLGTLLVTLHDVAA